MSHPSSRKGAATPAGPSVEGECRPDAGTPASPAPGAAGGPGWHVVWTRPRQERVAEENLLRQDYEVWLPMLGKWRRRAGGWACQTQPMFPRYLFLHARAEVQDLSRVRSTIGAVGLVRFGERTPVLAEATVAALRELADQTLAQAPDHPLRPGARVRIVSGPLAGLEGLVTVSAARRVEIFLSLLGRETLVKMSRDQLALVSD